MKISDKITQNSVSQGTNSNVQEECPACNIILASICEQIKTYS